MRASKLFCGAAVAVAVSVGAVAALAQAPRNEHQDHVQNQAPAQPAPGAQPRGAGEMDGMIRMMGEIMPMMERMRMASPEERARMMERMRPMMRDMMPMMQGMMGGGAGGHSDHAAQSAAAAAPSTRAFLEASQRMHRDMAIAFTGDADVDFVRGMIPHHQGAIDMARVVLQHGKNETARKWAGDIIREQEREIAEMREWLRLNAR